ncbi:MULTISPECIES: LTA synthase family protein [Pseudomonas]|uniref:Sulfatase n=1 Tax=Pseudomonas putida (strain W619) TaxID=390235 RepID=B1J921_PSEPW|nr:MULTISPECIES: LTA synthase family protein [Pseudomonas]MDH1573958.1 LTA synthase family protein [Pseudomonas sp. GD03746]QQE81778.1 LTA synthase family protein [Pseudomonas putida]UTL79066.1 LTA synthase family protein [Pseudomonas putida]HEN8710725.1 LTA synthase family protein [Pseudomonas putida]HEN8715794.1 LTA synthase family protein [Pseudomonas putida]
MKNLHGHTHTRLVALATLVMVIPLAARTLLGWSNPLGYLSDLALGSLLVLLLHRRPWWLATPVLLAWAALWVASAELVSAVGRLPTSADLGYLFDTQFMENSTDGGLANTWLPWVLGAGLLVWARSAWRSRTTPDAPLGPKALAIPLTLFGLHWGAQHLAPSEAEQWRQYNLPHQLLSVGVGTLQHKALSWAGQTQPITPLPSAGLTQSDLNGQKLASGRARNLLVITLEGIPGAYVRPNRQALHSRFDENLMPNLSRWAERGMNTPDYVLHTHQTIRGLYAMLCGDYDKLANGTPKGMELLTQHQRNQACLPAQLRQAGFTTHYLQGAGLRFMAKDRIMPHIGFDSVHGLEWFSNENYLQFPWGKDDRAFFEGALDYVGQLRQQDRPWMLTLLTVGTHQPYSAPAQYLERHDTAKQAAVAYLDDAIGAFLDNLERQGVLEDTLVVVTSDESHGIDGVRLASSWGFNLTLAPEQAQLPHIKHGTYGHIDLATSLLDYFALPIPAALGGRSLYRNYDTGREMISYTNAMLRYHDGQGVFTECDFQQRCRRYASEGFIAEKAKYLGAGDSRLGAQLGALAGVLDQSLLQTPLNLRYQFGGPSPIQLQARIRDDWADNLIGAQYMEMPGGSRTRVRVKVRALDPQHAAYIQLKAKEREQDVPLGLPAEIRVTAAEPLEMEFGFDNPTQRKAFSFHLLGYGAGEVEVSDFSVITALPGEDETVEDGSQGHIAQSS